MTTTMKLFDLCQRIRPELGCLGDLGQPLLDVVTVIERLGGTQTVAVLSQPGFALDVLTAGKSNDAASVGRVLDFLRIRADADPATAITTAAGVTVAEAVALYEKSALALMAPGTRSTYRTWTRRLISAHGDQNPRSLTAGDLTDLIAVHVVANRSDADRRRSGRSAAENAVGSFRHLWCYLCDKGYATTNIALGLRKQHHEAMVRVSTDLRIRENTQLGRPLPRHDCRAAPLCRSGISQRYPELDCPTRRSGRRTTPRSTSPC